MNSVFLTHAHIYLQLHGNLQMKNFIKYKNYLQKKRSEMAFYLRVMWKMESQALMWERKALPKPWPAWAPFTKPAISTTFRNAGTLLEGKVKEKLRSCHWWLGAESADNCIMCYADMQWAPGWFMVLAEEVKALIWNGHTTLIRVDGAKGKILSRCLTLCQNIEERRLSEITNKLMEIKDENKDHWHFVMHNKCTNIWYIYTAESKMSRMYYRMMSFS